MKYTYKTKGTCSTQIELEIENDTLINANYIGGCNGNLKGITRLVRGMKLDEICQRLEGITCGKRSTSCPDQLCQAIHEVTALEH